MSRQSRSSSIPIPRSSSSLSSTSPTRNIEYAIPMQFSGTSPHSTRPRMPPAVNSTPQRLSIPEDPRSALGVGTHRPTTVSTSPVRAFPRSFTHAPILAARVSASRTPSVQYEPRHITTDYRTSPDTAACLPSTSSPSTTPARSFRMSTGSRPPSIQRAAPSVVTPPAPPPPSIAFPRPAYLDHSALRHYLHTEDSSDLPPARKSETVTPATTLPVTPHVIVPPRARAMSPPTDSEEESNASPPRELPSSTSTPSALLSTDVVLNLPTRWSDSVRHPALSVSADGRDLTYHGPSSSGDKDAAAARTIHPIPPACGIYYYEVEILSKGQKGHISIGFAGGEVRLSRLPGWEKNSWGYHGDDGFSFAAERNGTPYGPTFGTGDIIGCGIDFSQNRAFYTKDGTFLGMVFDKVGKDCPIFPSVGLRHAGEAIRVNFGHEPFKFDIDDHVLQQRNATWSSILATPLDWALIEEHTAVGEPRVFPATAGKGTPASEEQLKVPINQLVLSYLAHHGYARTARAFQAQCEGRGGIGAAGIRTHFLPQTHEASASSGTADHDMELDAVPSQSSAQNFDGLGPGMHEGDIELRTRIVSAVVQGDIDTALSELRAHHPSVLEREEGLMLFKLRCRKFIELLLEAAELKKRMRAEEGGEDVPATGAMDVDDDASSQPMTNGFGSTAIPIKNKRKESFSWSGAATAQFEAALSRALAYGQELQTDYQNDKRSEVRTIFKRTFGIIAYEDPLTVGGQVTEVAGAEAKVALANELNQAILKSQGRPTHPALERLYRQTAACIVQLGLLGVGAAAFADMQTEFLEA